MLWNFCIYGIFYGIFLKLWNLWIFFQFMDDSIIVMESGISVLGEAWNVIFRDSNPLLTYILICSLHPSRRRSGGGSSQQDGTRGGKPYQDRRESVVDGNPSNFNYFEVL